jgi:hypothetical protein
VRKAANLLVGIVLCVCLFPVSGGAGEPYSMTSFFPDLGGWSRDGEPESYFPESLFEYINGGADVYLSYDFVELATLSYDGKEKSSLTIDIYRHRDLRNAFGIYSQEKSQSADFVSIGTEGYHDEGVLNFFHGPYYVKIMGFYLGDNDKPLLTKVAQDVAAQLGGDPRFPEVLACLPETDRVPHSERYLARDVLGYGFLHSAYTAEYEAGDARSQIFIFEADGEADARKMLDAYLKLADKKPAELTATTGDYRFVDPRRSSSGPVTLRHSGRYFWGLFSDDEAVADSFIEAIETNLKNAGLIE